MSMSVVQNSFQVIPFQEPDTQHKGVYLHESIIKSFNLNQSQVNKHKLNNNSLPFIQTDMLNTFNPEAFRPVPQNNYSFRQNSFQKVQKVQRPFIRPASQNSKVKVNFSYGFGQQKLPIIRQNVFSSAVNQNQPSFGVNLISKRENNLFGQKLNVHTSLEVDNNRPFSNLSQLSKSKKAYLEVSNSQNNPLKQFADQKNNEEVKTHKLGKKFRNVKFTNQNAGESVNLRHKTEHQERIEHPSKNSLSLLSMERSQYVFLPEDQAQIINLTPQSYIFSQNIIMSRPIKHESREMQNRIGIVENEMISPIQEREGLSSQINIRDQQEHYVPSRKSPKRIDNKIYLEENQGLQTIESKGSRLIELENINRLSRISVKGANPHEIQTEPNDILSKQDLNDFENKKVEAPQTTQIEELLEKAKEPLGSPKKTQQNQQLKTQNKRLHQKIADLQERLHQKQQENLNLQKRLENQEISNRVQTEYEKLEIMSKLNEIEIKKLKNQIKMFQIREKFYLNNQQEKVAQINALKNQIKSLKKNPFDNLSQNSTLNRQK